MECSNAVHLSETLFQAVKSFKWALRGPVALGQQVRSIASLCENFCYFSPHTHFALKITKIPNILHLPFDVYKIGKLGNDTFCLTTTIHKIRTVATIITCGTRITENIATACQILNTLGITPNSTTEWIPTFRIIKFIVSFISLSMDVENIKEIVETALALKETLTYTKKTTEKDKKSTALLKALQNIEKGGKRLQKQLLIPKRAKLAEKITVLSKKLSTADTPSIEESEKLLRTLKKRVRSSLIVANAQVAYRLSKIVGIAFLLFSTLYIGGSVALTISGTISLSIWAGRAFFITPNPFDPNSQCLANRMLVHFLETIALIRCHLTPVCNTLGKYV